MREVDDDEQLNAIAGLLGSVLGDAALGAYLHGSTGSGRRRPTSDTDVLVVTTRPMTDGERRALVDGIRPLSGRRAANGPARPVELTAVVGSDVRPWRRPPMEDFLYGEWERATYDAGELPARHENEDLAPLLVMVLAADRPLFGPPPASLLDPVPEADLVEAVVAGVPDLLADLDDDTRNVLLTLARIWVTAATGALVPKDKAADWAIARLPAAHRDVLARARDDYDAPTYGSFADVLPEARACADALVDAIRAAALSRMG